MDEEVQALPQKPGEGRKSNSIRRFAVYAIVLIIVFLLGFVPMWISARRQQNQLLDTQKKLGLSTIQNSIGDAVVDARAGNFEPSRREASAFFTTLSGVTNDTRDSSLSSSQQTALQPILAQRDEIITLLARNDGTAVDRLTDIYNKYRSTVGGVPEAAPSK